jgi:hypothetical protein
MRSVPPRGSGWVDLAGTSFDEIGYVFSSITGLHFGSSGRLEVVGSASRDRNTIFQQQLGRVDQEGNDSGFRRNGGAALGRGKLCGGDSP